METYWNPDLPPVEKEGLFDGEYEVEDIYDSADGFPQ